MSQDSVHDLGPGEAGPLGVLSGFLACDCGRSSTFERPGVSQGVEQCLKIVCITASLHVFFW